jgi:hypothetical protein
MARSHISPLTWERITFSGDFLWERAATTADKRRPLKSWAAVARRMSLRVLGPFGLGVV